MRRMSFGLTKFQMIERAKFVTRRLGWSNLKPGEKFVAVEKCMVLAHCQCITNRRHICEPHSLPVCRSGMDVGL
jgi:hypothetical protein